MDRWRELFEISGPIGALLFTGIALRIDSRVRRPQTLIEIIKQHRELWVYFDEHPKLAGLFDTNRDMSAHPLTDEEVRFANFLFLHLRASYGAKKPIIHVLPEHVDEDWRGIFTHPAVGAAWHRRGCQLRCPSGLSPARHMGPRRLRYHIGASTDSHRSAAPREDLDSAQPSRGSASGARPFRPPGAVAPSAALSALAWPAPRALRTCYRTRDARRLRYAPPSSLSDFGAEDSLKSF